MLSTYLSLCISGGFSQSQSQFNIKLCTHTSCVQNMNSIDIDECAMSPNPCDHSCTNNNGSFVRSCNNGYELGDDQRSCNGKCITK